MSHVPNLTPPPPNEKPNRAVSVANEAGTFRPAHKVRLKMAENSPEIEL
jgi:hypothetical protein